MALSSNSPDESQSNEWLTENEDSDPDDFYNISSQVEGENAEAGPESVGPPEPPTPHTLERLQRLRKSPATARTFTDPFVAVKEDLWFLPNINKLVKSILERMGKAFAYNSVYFLKVILELQCVYAGSSSTPPATAILDVKLILKTAEVLSGRLTRTENDNISLSRELQLRTLICALTLLHKLEIERLDGDAYAQLLRDISERDATNVRRHETHGDGMTAGDNEFLTRYACDLVRGLPKDLPVSSHLNQETIHFLFAAGFINQLETRPSRQAMDAIFGRITAEPSFWHQQMRSIYDGTTETVALQQRSKQPTESAQPAANVATDVAQSIITSLRQLLGQRLGIESVQEPVCEIKNLIQSPASHDLHIFVSGLLDCLNHHVATCAISKDITQDAVELARHLIRKSDRRAERYKAYEIIISSTVGVSENEYYSTMRNLDFEIEDIARTLAVLDPRSEKEKLERVERLKREKRRVMDRYEKKAVLYTGAAESIQRRVRAFSTPQVRRKAVADGGLSPTKANATSLPQHPHLLHSAPPSTAASNYVRRRPVSSATDSNATGSSRTSQVPTLSGSDCHSATDTGTCSSLTTERETWETVSDDNNNATILLSPTDCSVCKCCCGNSSPTASCTDSCHTLLQSPRSPSLSSTPLHSPDTPREPAGQPHPKGCALDLKDAVSPGPDEAVKLRELSQLISSPGLSPWEDPESEDTDPQIPSTPPDGPIQRRASDISQDPQGNSSSSKVPICVTTSDLPFRRDGFISNQSSESLSSSVMSHMIGQEPSPVSEELNQSTTPLSTYPEPSISRPSSFFATLKRQGQVARRDRAQSSRPAPNKLRGVNKPLPPIFTERSKDSILADNAPEVAQPPRPARCQSVMELRRAMIPQYAHMRNNSTGYIRAPHTARFTGTLPPIADATAEHSVVSWYDPIDYGTTPIETLYKVQSKDTCFATWLSSDGKHAVFLSPFSFQVFSIPTPGQQFNDKPRFHYRLGDWEGFKRNRVPWRYKSLAVSDRYVVTITKERLQVHDLAEDCRVIFNDNTKGWEHSAVAIAADRLVVSLSQSLAKGENIGKIRIYRMNSLTFEGHRYNRFGDEMFIIDRREPQDAPHMVSLSPDGCFLTAATPRLGHYFVWDITRLDEPRLVLRSQLERHQGPGVENPETITGVTVFPDQRHVLISTFVHGSSLSQNVGSYTQSLMNGSKRPVRSVSVRVAHSAVSPNPKTPACAFISKNGTVWTSPMIFFDGDENMSSFAPSRSQKRLEQQSSPDEAAKVAFVTPGEHLVAVDKKGKILVSSFPLQHVVEEPREELAGVPVTPPAPQVWSAKNGMGGYI